MNDDRKSSSQARYQSRFERVLDHIEAHLHAPLEMEQLAAVAHFSRFHFQRQFADFTGVGVARYILLMRLKHASLQLAFQSQRRIIDIALEAGFENPESFTRAFKSAFGQSPSQFRRAPDWPSWNERFVFRIPERKVDVQVEIVNVEPIRIAMLTHRGPVNQLNATVARFIEWRKATGLSPVERSRTFGLAWDNPDTTPPEQFRFGICGEVDGEVPDNVQGVEPTLIPGGRCARVRHAGAHERLGESIYPLYRQWLPQSGEELRDFPLYFHYLNLLPDTPPGELLTDIYMPLK
jgi:AraC family transcriptional regulator